MILETEKRNAAAWRQYSLPFLHYRCTEVFPPDIAEGVDQEFRRVLSKGLYEERKSGRFARIFVGYDAYGTRLPRQQNNSLRVFASETLHDEISNLFKVETTGDLSVELHHHAVGSASGKIHNDLNPGWFVKTKDGTVNLHDRRSCSYRTGQTSTSSSAVIKRVRAIAMIYYVANGVWHHGDGGETALYGDASCSKRSCELVAPLDNSAVVFECTPFSYHRFLSNRAKPRNSVVMWLHQTEETCRERWGDQVIVDWQN